MRKCEGEAVRSRGGYVRRREESKKQESTRGEYQPDSVQTSFWD